MENQEFVVFADTDGQEYVVRKSEIVAITSLGERALITCHETTQKNSILAISKDEYCRLKGILTGKAVSRPAFE